jgi:hypothetical protein
MTRLPLNLRYLLQFAALSFLCLGAHELLHHLAVRLTCGAWGTMTFWQFERPAGCSTNGASLFATLAGPLLTWLLIWGGRAMIHHGEARAGVTLILANLPLARVVTVLMQGGDEMVLARALAPGNALWLPMLVLTLLLFWAPVRTAYSALQHSNRLLVLAAALVLPLGWDVLLKRVWLAAVLEAHPASVAGIPLVFVVAVMVALVLLALLRRPPAAPIPPLARAMISQETYAISGAWKVK